jgi:hypothetical protein
MKKKAALELTLTWLIDIILLAVMIFFVFNPALDKVQNNDQFFKRFSSKNVALLIDTLYTTPYPIKMYYDEKTLSYSYQFEENHVYLLSPGESENSENKIGYIFIEDKNKKFDYKTISPSLSVNQNIISVGDNGAYIPLAFIANKDFIKPLSAVPTSAINSVNQ